jgi:Ca2+-transporting ATPase
MAEKWHTLSLEDVQKGLGTSEKGLDRREAKRRLERYGLNKLPEKKRVEPLSIFLGQFKSFLIFILVVATAISFLIGEWLDGYVILAILVANAILGFVQEYKAEKALMALKQLAVPQATVKRDGKLFVIPATEIVPGDLVVLEEGEKVPADCRLINVSELTMDESMLTGESTPVHKDVRAVGDVPVADRKCMAFMGTIVSYGRAEALVISTGLGTEIGKIAGMLKGAEETTPLQKKLSNFGRWLGAIILIIIAAIFSLEMLRGGDMVEMLITAIALAVAAVPEGLPAVVTITLAIGVSIMARKNALIRRLATVETLGSTTVVCADKTGTMTTNEMTVQRLWVEGKEIEVTGIGFEPKGSFKGDGAKSRGVRMLSEIAAFCNNSVLEFVDEKWRVLGDPTEGALMVMAAKAGVKPDMKGYERIKEIPFSSERKMMATVYKTPKGRLAYVKGAPEVILENCTHIYGGGSMSKKEKEEALRSFDEMAKDGLRVLGLAYRPVKSGEKDIEKGLTFVGLAGMIDPPREEVKDAIRTLANAGMKTIMITGDHKITALAIARKLGLIQDSKGLVLTGDEIKEMSDKKLDSVVDDISVYARVSPEHKVRILESLRRKGHIVAMTGDGVNDAPALKKADIGVAMGLRGTDVSREASDMVLLDDNFATIARAVEEGRGIYDNIRKFVRFLLAANTGEIIVVALAVFAGLPLPLLAIQILWMNLLTDGLPAVALSFDPKSKDVMSRPPRKPKEGILHGTVDFIAATGIITAIATLGVFLLALSNGGDVTTARTMAFTTIVLFELMFVFNCRSDTRSIFRNNPLTNRKLLMAVAVSVILQFAIIYLPFAQPLFGTAALSAQNLLLSVGFACMGFFVFPEIFMKADMLLPKRRKREAQEG